MDQTSCSKGPDSLVRGKRLHSFIPSFNKCLSSAFQESDTALSKTDKISLIPSGGRKQTMN